MTAAESLGGEKIGVYFRLPAFARGRHAVGSRGRHALVAGWAGYEDRLPGTSVK